MSGLAPAGLRWLVRRRELQTRGRGSMKGKFIRSSEVQRDQVPWGSLAWFSSPAASSATALVVIEVDLNPGSGHAFTGIPTKRKSST